MATEIINGMTISTRTSGDYPMTAMTVSYRGRTFLVALWGDEDDCRMWGYEVEEVGDNAQIWYTSGSHGEHNSSRGALQSALSDIKVAVDEGASALTAILDGRR